MIKQGTYFWSGNEACVEARAQNVSKKTVEANINASRTGLKLSQSGHKAG